MFICIASPSIFVSNYISLHHMASHKIKIHEQCMVSPPSAIQTSSLPLTFFDFRSVRFHPIEFIFFYSLLPVPQSHPSFFFDKVLPNLKTSLSFTLQHFLPLAGNLVWPSHSPIPIVQYNPGDAVSLVVAESHDDIDFNNLIDNSPHEAAWSRSLVPHLYSSDSRASVVSLQITLFPNEGFSIGISMHHGVLDGKSSTLFIKAWASLCKEIINDETQTPSLVKELTPFFDRKVIKEPTHLGDNYIEKLTGYLAKYFPDENPNARCLKILPFPMRLKDTVRASFVLTRGDLEKIKERVLSKWDEVEEGREEESETKSRVSSKPATLSSFILSCAYVAVCIAKAINGVEREKQKFGFAFGVDCRARLEPRIPDNYCGNCAWLHIVDAKPLDFIKEQGLVIVAQSIHREVNKLNEEGGIFHSSSEPVDLAKAGVEIIAVAMSNRFRNHGTDFGWGKPVKVEIAMVDRGLSFGLSESEDGNGGVRVQLVLNKLEMDLFVALFHQGLCDD